jgi:hypothetical protein
MRAGRHLARFLLFSKHMRTGMYNRDDSVSALPGGAMRLPWAGQGGARAAGGPGGHRGEGRGAARAQARARFRLAVLMCAAVALVGCARVAPEQQRLVSKPNMQFSDSHVFDYQTGLLTQIESGSASFTGGQSAGCGSCGE